MSKYSFLLTTLFSVVTATAASTICSNIAMSEPLLIEPSSHFYERIYRNEEAFDFCAQQTLGFIVVSPKVRERLQKYYPIRETCINQVSSEALNSNSNALDSNSNVLSDDNADSITEN
jgi:hypothetical protein